MFVLARLIDSVRIEPKDFKKSFLEALQTTLNNKLANKIILNVGLCICFYDFEKIEDSLVLPGDGASHTKVHFRFVVFRPFIDEVLIGKIRTCTREGIHVSMGFFDQIFVPDHKLPDNSRFNEKDQVWIWDYEIEPGNSAEMFMDTGREVRFKVVEEKFQDTQPVGPEIPVIMLEDSQASQTPTSTEKRASYSIFGAMNEPGLGCLEWWLQA